MKRLAVAIIGGTVLVFGIVLLVLPGPAVVVIPIGLAILAAQFTWAEKLLQKGQAFIARRKVSKRDVEKNP